MISFLQEDDKLNLFIPTEKRFGKAFRIYRCIFKHPGGFIAPRIFFVLFFDPLKTVIGTEWTARKGKQVNV
jgi:hypothetical protein